MRRAGSAAARAAAAGLAIALAAAAQAELFRCTTADGRTVFTDDKSVCPAAQPYQPDAAVHSVDRAASPAPASPPGARPAARGSAAGAQSGEAERWRALKASKQDELRQVASDRQSLESAVTWCNRGGKLLTRDDAGIKRTLSCDELRGRYAALDARETELRAYLDHGLAEECRRAGCLPGWIR
jgi:hypothetical protein